MINRTGIIVSMIVTVLMAVAAVAGSLLVSRGPVSSQKAVAKVTPTSSATPTPAPSPYFYGY